MKILIKKIKRRVVGLIDHFAWNKQYRQLVSEPRKENFTLDAEWYKDRKILMMVPHADDELISSYTVLIGATDLTIYYCGFTGSNNTKRNKITRRSEIFKLCSILNIEVIEGDGECENLEIVIKQGNYDTILLPSIVDWHNEHRKISYMINEVCKHLNIKPKIFCYSVTVPNESTQEVLCAPLSKEQQDSKYGLFKRVYLSQIFMPSERLMLNERINGFQVGSYAAEAFMRYDFDIWSRMVSQIESLEEINDLKFRKLLQALQTNLNNLILVRQSSREFYKWLDEVL